MGNEPVPTLSADGYLSPVQVAEALGQDPSAWVYAQNKEMLVQMMTDAGPGSRAIVYGSRGADGIGHYFNIINDNGTIRIIDGQTHQVVNLGDFQDFSILQTAEGDGVAITSDTLSPHLAEVGGGATTVPYADRFMKSGRTKILRPDIQYVDPNGYAYATDSSSRIISVDAGLQYGVADRNTYAQRKIAHQGTLNDQGGHLIASIFQGSGDIDNLVPMNQNLNQGKWKVLENQWSAALQDEKSVQVHIDVTYGDPANPARPTEFTVNYTIDGVPYKESLKNTPGGV